MNEIIRQLYDRKSMLVFGYPTEQQKERKKPERANLKYLVRENEYTRFGEEELRGMLGKTEHRDDYESWIRAFYARKYNSDFALELNRSVKMFLRQFGTEDCNG